MSAKGRLELIAGPMFAGKTTELLRRLFCDTYVNRKALYINHTIDNRTNEAFSTHNPLYKDRISESRITLMKCSVLPGLEEIKNYDTVGVDEAQFFEDLSQLCIYADNGIRVIVAGLVGDSNREKFGKMCDLLPMADDYTQLHALCAKCASSGTATNSSFTSCISVHSDQVDVGGSDKYAPMCRNHYLELSS